ncbi:hypothetical protein HYX04_04195 [Candidatus Woesearchaeota archaeon]|nr:hypothetical protein [Candidatus Woesearchaeota archaeon]
MTRSKEMVLNPEEFMREAARYSGPVKLIGQHTIDTYQNIALRGGPNAWVQYLYREFPQFELIGFPGTAGVNYRERTHLALSVTCLARAENLCDLEKAIVKSEPSREHLEDSYEIKLMSKQLGFSALSISRTCYFQLMGVDPNLYEQQPFEVIEKTTTETGQVFRETPEGSIIVNLKTGFPTFKNSGTPKREFGDITLINTSGILLIPKDQSHRKK